MIRKLRFRFILLAAASLFILLAIVVACMNLINYYSVVHESDQLLSLLSQNDGTFPEGNAHSGNRFSAYSPETPYESRYFTITLSLKGEIKGVDISRIAAVDRETAIDYAHDIYSKGRASGFVHNYRYLVYESMDRVSVSFLDCRRSLDSFRNFFTTSIAVSLFGYAAIFVAIYVLSGRIVQPIAEAYHKQRQFITDAGHELKTPITIINANLDILEMEIGEDNENVVEIGTQAKRLRSLTDELVMLTRMEESENSLNKIEFPLSDVVAEAAHPFYVLASSQGKEFVCNIQPMLTLNGNDKSIRQLISLLLDNAMKYSPANGNISLTLEKKNKRINLVVFNTTAIPVQKDQLTHVFDRFYRTDESRNSETGGHGIGLSVAQAIVGAHGGEISAMTSDGMSFQISVSLTA